MLGPGAGHTEGAADVLSTWWAAVGHPAAGPWLEKSSGCKGGAKTWGWVAEACRYGGAKNSPPLAMWPVCNYWDSS